MKLVHIYSLKDPMDHRLNALIAQIGGRVYSKVNVDGVYAQGTDEEAWVGHQALSSDSELRLIACTDDQADKLIEGIKNLNEDAEFPIHAYALNIEKSTES